MNFIYFGNAKYNTEEDEILKIVDNINKKKNYNIIIYGGNFINLLENNKKENNINLFLNTINKLSDKKIIILFGNYDYSNEIILKNEIDFYKKFNNIPFNIVN